METERNNSSEMEQKLKQETLKVCSKSKYLAATQIEGQAKNTKYQSRRRNNYKQTTSFKQNWIVMGNCQLQQYEEG
jgi:hypothetical protein